MRKSLLYIIVSLLPMVMFCQTITPEQASQVARNFYFERVNLVKNIPINEIQVSRIRTSGNGTSFYYICDLKPEGFVIVSASNLVIPVLAYSFESSYAEQSDLPLGFRVWMEHYSKQIEYAISLNHATSEETDKEWKRLLNSNHEVAKELKKLQSVAPLLVSKWNQDIPYNSWCPTDAAGPGGHCLTGCVATAMGQLLYYYRFPNQGQGSYSYTHPDYGTISANFGVATYKWNAMPSATAKECNAFAELLFHQGVSVDMDYGPDGSGMWNHKAAYSLKTYFRYGPETQYYFRDSVSIDWDSLLVANLNQKKPLYYAGWAGVQSTSGHAFVCDGYQPGNYYHFNWGWGGSQDGYFYTSNLTPGGNNFNFAQEVIPLFPDTLQNAYPNYCQGNTVLNSLRGSVEDGSGWYNYENNANCSWLISPQDAEYDSIKSIKIAFLRFDTESEGDTLYLFDGIDASAPLIGAYTGNTLPVNITSTGNKVFILFHSNSAITKGGWQLDYESIFPVYCSGTTTLTESAGTIEDGSGDKKYSSNSVCRWKIITNSGLPVVFDFTSFDTYDSIDIVKIYDLQSQEVLGTFSGSQIPPTIISNSGKMMILFMTNSIGNAQGWTGSFYSSGVGINKKDPVCFETRVYPNPTQGKLFIEKYCKSNSQIIFRLIDEKGSTVYYNTANCVEGLNDFLLNLCQVKDSAYFLIIQEGNEKEKISIVIKK